jgi:aminomethyltransferase
MTALRHYETPLLKTPFHARTEAACKTWSWGNWGGYATVLTFEDLCDGTFGDPQFAATVYDLCPMIKYRIEGPEATAFLEPADDPQCGQAVGRRSAIHRLGQ